MPAAMVDLLDLRLGVTVENRRLGPVQFIENARAWGRDTRESLGGPQGGNRYRRSGKTESRHQKLPSFHCILQEKASLIH